MSVNFNENYITVYAIYEFLLPAINYVLHTELQDLGHAARTGVQEMKDVHELGGVVVSVTDSWSRGRGFDYRPLHHQVTTLGKLFTPMCLCHQTV